MRVLFDPGVLSPLQFAFDFVVLFASHAVQKDADEDHAYGHHRLETAASLAP